MTKLTGFGSIFFQCKSNHMKNEPVIKDKLMPLDTVINQLNILKY